MKNLCVVLFSLYFTHTMAQGEIPKFDSKAQEALPDYHRKRNLEEFVDKFSNKVNSQIIQRQNDVKKKFTELEKLIKESPKNDSEEIIKLIQATKKEINDKHDEDIESLRNEIRDVDFKISQNFQGTLKSLREDLFKLRKELEEQRKLIGQR